jgi:hypothetical protein
VCRREEQKKVRRKGEKMRSKKEGEARLTEDVKKIRQEVDVSPRADLRNINS